jgi:hypothetical protein
MILWRAPSLIHGRTGLALAVVPACSFRFSTHFAGPELPWFGHPAESATPP